MYDAAIVVTFPELNIFGISAGIIALGVIIGLLVKIWRGLSALGHVVDDWKGTEGDSNHPPTKGMVARLSDVEDSTRKSSEYLELVAGQLGRNGGSTVADAAFESKRLAQDLTKQLEKMSDEHKEFRDEHKAWRDQYDQDKMNERREWVGIFRIVEEMIRTESTAEKAAMWDAVVKSWLARGA